MLIYDDVFTWDGWGGVFRLGGGKCHLRIFDFSRTRSKKLTLLKPIVVMVSDLTEESMTMKQVSIRSCVGHIATCVTQQFKIDPNRMIFVEYYPQQTYGQNQEHIIAERFDAVDFEWHTGKALHPKWRSLPSALAQTLDELIRKT
jgi:hypothetical protein